jgi:hypothetical protein
MKNETFTKALEITRELRDFKDFVKPLKDPRNLMLRVNAKGSGQATDFLATDTSFTGEIIAEELNFAAERIASRVEKKIKALEKEFINLKDTEDETN